MLKLALATIGICFFTATLPAQDRHCMDGPLKITLLRPSSMQASDIEMEAKSMLQRHKGDRLLKDWPLDSDVLNIITIGGLQVYELASSQQTPFHWTKDLSMVSTFLLYENSDRALRRINLEASIDFWCQMGPDKGKTILSSGKAIKQFNEFIQEVPSNYTSSLTREDTSIIFITLVYHNTPNEFPCIVALSDEDVIKKWDHDIPSTISNRFSQASSKDEVCMLVRSGTGKYFEYSIRFERGSRVRVCSASIKYIAPEQ